MSECTLTMPSPPTPGTSLSLTVLLDARSQISVLSWLTRRRRVGTIANPGLVAPIPILSPPTLPRPSWSPVSKPVHLRRLARRSRVGDGGEMSRGGEVDVDGAEGKCVSLCTGSCNCSGDASSTSSNPFGSSVCARPRRPPEGHLSLVGLCGDGGTTTDDTAAPGMFSASVVRTSTPSCHVPTSTLEPPACMLTAHTPPSRTEMPSTTSKRCVRLSAANWS